MVVVGVRPLRQQPQTSLEVRGSHAGVELPAKIGLGHGGLVFGGLVHEGQLVVFGRDEIAFDRVERIGSLFRNEIKKKMSSHTF